MRDYAADVDLGTGANSYVGRDDAVGTNDCSVGDIDIRADQGGRVDKCCGPEALIGEQGVHRSTMLRITYSESVGPIGCIWDVDGDVVGVSEE